MYDNYKFLTKEDLEKLNLTHLIGTNLLRAYMHGYFIDYRLYKKAQAPLNPFTYDEYIERRKKEKFKKERDSRITIKRKLPKVNRPQVKQLLENEEAANLKEDVDNVDAKNTSKKKKGLTIGVLQDERFKCMIENTDLIDENSHEYRALHPIPSLKQPSLVAEHFQPVMDGEEPSDSDDSAATESSEDENEKDSRKNSRVPRMYEVKDERHAEAFSKQLSLAKEDALSLGERVAALPNDRTSHDMNNIKVGPGGSREVSFFSGAQPSMWKMKETRNVDW